MLLDASCSENCWCLVTVPAVWEVRGSAGCWPSWLPGQSLVPVPTPAAPSPAPPPGAADLSLASIPQKPRSLQRSLRPSQNSNARSELSYKKLGRKTIERVKKLLQRHTDGDKWNQIDDATFSSILVSRVKEISIANPTLTLNEISNP